MKARIRVKVSHQDPAFVLIQSRPRSYAPFAHAFGTKRISQKNAALIVKSVNCCHHLIKALQAVQRTSRLPVNGNGERMRTRLNLIGRYAAAALKQVNS